MISKTKLLGISNIFPLFFHSWFRDSESSAKQRYRCAILKAPYNATSSSPGRQICGAEVAKNKNSIGFRLKSLTNWFINIYIYIDVLFGGVLTWNWDLPFIYLLGWGLVPEFLRLQDDTLVRWFSKKKIWECSVFETGDMALVLVVYIFAFWDAPPIQDASHHQEKFTKLWFGYPKVNLFIFPLLLVSRFRESWEIEGNHTKS